VIKIVFGDRVDVWNDFFYQYGESIRDDPYDDRPGPLSWKTTKKGKQRAVVFTGFVGFFTRRDRSPFLLGFPIMCRHHAARWHVLLGSCPWPITTSQACSPWPDMLTWTSGALGRDARKEREAWKVATCERPVCVHIDILCVRPFSLATTTFQTLPYVSCAATFLCW